MPKKHKKMGSLGKYEIKNTQNAKMQKCKNAKKCLLHFDFVEMLRH